MTSNWPQNFTQWVQDDVGAAKAWFADPANNNFEEWRGKNANSKEWAPFENCVKLIVGYCGVSPQAYKKIWKDTCKSLLAGKDTMQKRTQEDDKQIGQIESDKLQGMMMQDFREDPATKGWMKLALTALAPRTVHAWKKSIRRSKKDAKGEDNDDDNDENDDGNGDGKSISTEATTNKTLTLQTSVSSSPNTRRLRPRQGTSIIRTNRPPKSVAFDAGENLLHDRQKSATTLFVFRNITVMLDEDIASKDQTAPSHIVIGIGTILAPSSHVLMQENIRPEHVDFVKFRKLLEAQHNAFDVSKNKLVVDIPGEGDGIAVDDGDEFVRVIGLLHLHSGGREEIRMRVLGPRYYI